MKYTRFITLIVCSFVIFCSSNTLEKDYTAAELRAREILQEMTFQEKILLISGYRDGFHTAPVERLGIPSLRLADGPQGIRNNTQSTFYPCGQSLAASWNRELAWNVGKGLGLDAKARGIDILLAPGVNIYRSAVCGRNFEYFGEDPYLAGEIAVSYIQGVQSEGVMATVKHFAANNQEYKRHATNSIIDERTLNEIYFPVFKKAIKEAEVACVMTSYNPLNGIHAAENKNLIEGTLREKWGFKGIVMSDWESTYSTLGAVQSGLDLEMPSGMVLNEKTLEPLLEKGIITMEQIDLKCLHLLTSFIVYGHLEDMVPDNLPTDNPICHKIAYESALEGPVLLKNEGTLPLAIAPKDTVIILGPNADKIPFGGGSGSVTPLEHRKTTYLSGLQALLKENLVFLKPQDNGKYDSKRIRNAKYIIIAAGFDHDSEGEDRDRSFHLPDDQDQTIAEIASWNEKVIVLVNSGGEVAMPWKDDVEAIMMCWYPGQEGGKAIADLLTGKVSPSGKLPFTMWGTEEENPCFPYYKMEAYKNRDPFYHTPYYEGIFVGYRAYGQDKHPLFPFGYGLTYSSFKYTDLKIRPVQSGWKVSFFIENTGGYAAEEVVQLYISSLTDNEKRPERELKGFQKVSLEKGERKKVTMYLEPDDFSQYDLASGKFVVKNGKYMLRVCSNSLDDELCSEMMIE